VLSGIAALLASDPEIAQAYRATLEFHARLFGPPDRLTADVLNEKGESFSGLVAGHHARYAEVAFLPAWHTRYDVLAARVFPDGIAPPGPLVVDLAHRMRENPAFLEPAPDAGWAQRGAHAFAAYLLRPSGSERARYTLGTGFREYAWSDYRPGGSEAGPSGPPAAEVTASGEVCPRLRVEPAPEFYLRLARTVAFLHEALRATLGDDTLSREHALRPFDWMESAEREAEYRVPFLAEELGLFPLRLYGLYLVSCEDLGMSPELSADELPDRPRAVAEALRWLEGLSTSEDLTRVVREAVPLGVFTRDGQQLYWTVLGTRVAVVDVVFRRPPRVRTGGDGVWQEVLPGDLGMATCALPVYETAQFALRKSWGFESQEFQGLCDALGTRDDVLYQIWHRPAIYRWAAGAEGEKEAPGASGVASAR